MTNTKKQTIRLSKSDLDMYAAMEVVDSIRVARETLEEQDNFKTGSATHKLLLAEENKAATRAWLKMIKKFPGLCGYLYGNRSKKIKGDLHRLAKALKCVDMPKSASICLTPASKRLNTL